LDPKLRNLLYQYPLASAKMLASDLGISQQALSAKIRAANHRIVRIGKARTTRYALAYEGQDFPPTLPLYRIQTNGVAQPIANLILLASKALLVEPLVEESWLLGESEEGYFQDLPYFLEDLRPQGFLGRWIARQQTLGLPDDARLWTAWQLLRYLTEDGSDTSGNVMVGETVLAKASSLASARVDRKDITIVYPQMAQEILQGKVAGSSAGGEQPKFALRLEEKSVLVKFSPALQESVGQRWSDLLLCEHLALQTLQAANLAASQSEWLQAGNRAFLQVDRFDRVGTLGRKALFSLAILDAEYTGIGQGWRAVTQALAACHLLSSDAVRQVAVLDYFGELIGNTDRHLGNLSFSWEAGLFVLAPAYDMVPMHFAPERGELIERRSLGPLIPRDDEAWRFAFELAIRFWETLCADRRISETFCQTIATPMLNRLQAVK